jgi:hypothetical protein
MPYIKRGTGQAPQYVPPKTTDHLAPYFEGLTQAEAARTRALRARARYDHDAAQVAARLTGHEDVPGSVLLLKETADALTQAVYFLERTVEMAESNLRRVQADNAEALAAIAATMSASVYEPSL